jgi:orotidine-5'-phosphate decarboxylase
MSFVDRLDDAVSARGNPCLLGIDPHIALLPREYAVVRDARAPRAERAAALASFCIELVDLAAGRVAAVKPQSAFFEALGASGVAAWEDVVAGAHLRDLIVIGDVKRGDIASTAGAYAQAFLACESGGAEESACDAITVSPFLGADALEPFVVCAARADAGLYVLVRTSNPGSAAFQLHGEPPLAEKIAETVVQAGAKLRGSRGWSSVGAVVGATHAAELGRLRALLPGVPLLLPGYGAQGARAADVLPAFADREHPLRGALISSSRGIAFAWQKQEHHGRHWKDAASIELDRMIADVRAVLLAAR